MVSIWKNPRVTLTPVRGYIGSFLVLAASALAPRWAHAKPNLDLDAGIGEIYDDNVTFDEADKHEDFITQLSLGLGVTSEHPTQRFKLMGGLHQQIFARESDFNNLSEDLTADWRAEVSKYTRVRLDNTFIHAEEPRSFEDAFGRTPGRFRYLQNRFFGQIVHELGQQTRFRGRYKNEITNFSRKASHDSVFHQIGAQLEYSVSSETWLFGAYDFTLRDFNPGPTATAHLASLGVRQYLAPEIYVEGVTGWDTLENFNNDFIFRPRFQASLVHEVDEDSKAALTFERSYETTSYEQSLFRQWKASLNYDRQLLKRLSGRVGAFYGEAKYLSSDAKDGFTGAGLGFTYDLTPDWKADLSYRFWNVNSNLSTREFTKDTVMLMVTVTL